VDIDDHNTTKNIDDDHNEKVTWTSLDQSVYEFVHKSLMCSFFLLNKTYLSLSVFFFEILVNISILIR
jgi:hypothetical protein